MMGDWKERKMVSIIVACVQMAQHLEVKSHDIGAGNLLVVQGQVTRLATPSARNRFHRSSSDPHGLLRWVTRFDDLEAIFVLGHARALTGIFS